MRIFGIDFTSSPKPRKPITCLSCHLENGVLEASRGPERWGSFKEFEDRLKGDGPWIAGIDFPFGQSRKFIENIGWPQTWADYVRYAHSLGRQNFHNKLTAYRCCRSYGDREHRRATDVAAKSISPQKLHGVPVGLMFFEGAPRLIQAQVTIPGLQVGDPERVVVEAYPKMLVRKFGEGQSYKNDNKKKQTEDQLKVRCEMFSRIIGGACLDEYGFRVAAPASLVDDPSGDEFDALLCAIQAAWSWTERKNRFGAPTGFDSLEGWIADPSLRI
jgi:hypothetical protein